MGTFSGAVQNKFESWIASLVSAGGGVGAVAVECAFGANFFYSIQVRLLHRSANNVGTGMYMEIQTWNQATGTWEQSNSYTALSSARNNQASTENHILLSSTSSNGASGQLSFADANEKKKIEKRVSVETPPNGLLIPEFNIFPGERLCFFVQGAAGETFHFQGSSKKMSSAF